MMQQLIMLQTAKDILNKEEKKLAINALRYFDKEHHAVLAPEFAKELQDYGRIYM